MESAPTNRPVNLLIVISSMVIIFLMGAIICLDYFYKASQIKIVSPITKPVPVVIAPVQVPVTPKPAVSVKVVPISSCLNHGVYVKGNDRTCTK